MLYQFLFENFKSYKNETVFDMRAENIDEFEDSLIVDNNGEKLLPVSAIYGPNAGGKSGLLEALVCLISIVLKPRVILRNLDKKSKYRRFAIYNKLTPYMFDNDSVNKPTKFQIFFSTKNSEYKYNLSVLNNLIVSESLYKREFKAKKPAKIFEREENKIELGEILKKANAGVNVNENIPYLTFLSITNSIDIINDVISWFENITAVNYAKESFEKLITIYDDERKNIFIQLLRLMDIDIYDYRVEEIENNGDSDNRQKLKIYTIHEKNNKMYEIEFGNESEGTRKVFSLIPNLIDAMVDGGLVILDELDAKLHPKLLKYIIMIFKDRILNACNAQLIFTSQDLTTMNSQVFRRDEIWFACKNENKESEIYSLYEIRDENGEHIRANAPFNKQYLSGKYGADPFLDKMLNWEDINGKKFSKEE